MLKRMRDHFKALSITLWLVIAAFIGTTFLVWGMRATSDGGRRGMVATVGGEGISFEEYSRAYRQLYQQYQRLLGEAFDEKRAEELKLKEQALDGLIVRRLILQEAKRMGLSISAEELRAEIKAIPTFVEGGRFSRERYLRVLEANRLTPERFEEDFKKDLLVRKVEELIKGSAKVSPLEAWELYRASKEKLRVQYVLFPFDHAQGKPSKEETKASASKLLALLKEGRPFGKAAAEANLSAAQLSFTSGEPLKGIPDEAAFKEAAVALKVGETSPLVQGEKAAYLVHLLDRQDPDREEFEKEKGALLKALLLRKREQLFTQWLQELRAKRQVKVERELL